MKKTGVLIALAYPEEFVAMIPAWYKKPLEMLGVINNNMICAGHSALALINRETGIIEYADFGRYITPFGKGRTRTVMTDPECTFDIKAEFDDKGQIINEEEILIEIESDPEVTHGAGKLYASFCYGVDYEKAKAFISDINLQGSVPYDPFKKGGSNCARFVYDTFKAGIISRRRRLTLMMFNQFTPSPLSIVFRGKDQEEIYCVLDGKLEEYKGKRSTAIVKHLLRKPGVDDQSHEEKENLEDTHHWLDGVGANGWFRLTKPNGKYVFERRLPDGRKIFEEEFYSDNTAFDIKKPYKLVHDCNALWCTVKQDGNTFRLYHKKHGAAVMKHQNN